MLIHITSSNVTIHRKKTGNPVPGKRPDRSKQVARLLRRLSPVNWFNEFSDIPVTLEEMNYKGEASSHNL